MKISLNWINDYVDLSGIKTSDIIEKLTMSGLEVEDVYDQNSVYKGFVVGEVKVKEKHPDADKLSVCTVYDGVEDLQVICGAPNVGAGQKIVFARIGTIIPNGNFKIKKAKIRGEESYGMICAEDELLLSDDHTGIMVLKNDLTPGEPITKALDLNDTILEIAITPNRPDALSHIGVARDLSAIFNLELKLPQLKLNEENEEANKAASIEIIDETNCPRYVGKVIKDVKISSSPEWLAKKIKSIGLRPINSVVDVTNFVMYELGQPLHAFDLDLLTKNKIIVKSTSSKTKFTTLDSKERELPENTLMICDAERDVAIAGVMGGENSEINNNTKNILIESAFFKPVSIRKTSRNLGLSTDASYRFERGTDIGISEFAANRAAQLINEISGGKLLRGSIDVYPGNKPLAELKLRYNQVERILGYSVENKELKQILLKLGFNLKDEKNDHLLVEVPTYRPDVEREIDLIEEIARIYGYDNIPVVPKISITLANRIDESEFRDKLREVSESLGLNEIINNTLENKSEAEYFGNPVELLNPQSLDMAFLRTSLFAGGLKTVSRNIRHGEKNCSLYEIGNTFNYNQTKKINSFDDFEEREVLSFFLTGNKREDSWKEESEEYDFYSLKGLVLTFLQKFSLDSLVSDSYNSGEDKIFDYYFNLSYKKTELVKGGLIKQSVLKNFDIEQPVYIANIFVDQLKKIYSTKRTYTEPLKYPKVVRDFAFVFDSDVEYASVKNFIKRKSSSLLKSVKLFDIFESESLGKNKRSLAFKLEYFNESRTLKEEEVDKDFKNLIKLVTKEFNAQLRGS